MKRAMAAAFAACIPAMAGCLVVRESDTRYSGDYISASRLECIEPGRTTAEEVLEQLGEPTQRTPRDDGSEVWRYEYTQTKSSSGAVFLIFAGSSRKEVSGEVQVTVRDGVVQRVWRETRGA